MNFKEWLIVERKLLHQVGFMPGSAASVPEVLRLGRLTSSTGLVWLRPARFLNMIHGHAGEIDRTIWVEYPDTLNLLKVKDRNDLAKKTGVNGHTDVPDVSKALAARLREMGYQGFERSDFPEIAILDDVPHKVVGPVA